MPSVDSIAADYVERAAALDPFFATCAGIAGHDDKLPDLSPDGFAGRAELDRSALAALEAAEASGPREQVARAAMQERLAVAVERYDAGDTTSELNVIDSWVQYVRELFDLMPTGGEESAVNIARRMAAVPEAYRQFSRTLLGAGFRTRCAGSRRRPPARRRPPPPGSVPSSAGTCCRWPGRRPRRSWTATRTGASKGGRTSAPGCRTWPSAPSRNWTAGTSTSRRPRTGSRP